MIFEEKKNINVRRWKLEHSATLTMSWSAQWKNNDTDLQRLWKGKCENFCFLLNILLVGLIILSFVFGFFCFCFCFVLFLFLFFGLFVCLFVCLFLNFCSVVSKANFLFGTIDRCQMKYGWVKLFVMFQNIIPMSIFVQVSSEGHELKSRYLTSRRLV